MNGETARSSYKVATPIEYGGKKFLITAAPEYYDIMDYIGMLKYYEVLTLFCIGDLTYDPTVLLQFGIMVTEIPFVEWTSHFPADETIEKWCKHLREEFRLRPGKTVAVHCNTGYEYSPIMVCIALVELGLGFRSAIERIRDLRPGSIEYYQATRMRRHRPDNRLSGNYHMHRCPICKIKNILEQLLKFLEYYLATMEGRTANQSQ